MLPPPNASGSGAVNFSTCHVGFGVARKRRKEMIGFGFMLGMIVLSRIVVLVLGLVYA